MIILDNNNNDNDNNKRIPSDQPSQMFQEAKWLTHSGPEVLPQQDLMTN